MAIREPRSALSCAEKALPNLPAQYAPSPVLSATLLKETGCQQGAA